MFSQCLMGSLPGILLHAELVYTCLSTCTVLNLNQMFLDEIHTVEHTCIFHTLSNSICHFYCHKHGIKLHKLHSVLENKDCLKFLKFPVPKKVGADYFLGVI